MKIVPITLSVGDKVRVKQSVLDADETLRQCLTDANGQALTGEVVEIDIKAVYPIAVWFEGTDNSQDCEWYFEDQTELEKVE